MDKLEGETMKIFKTHIEIVMAMLRTGVLGFGGGPSVIPLFRHEAVFRYKWIDDEEFGDILAFANALPGPIATKMAAQLGYRQKGVSGACTAILAHILPTSIGIVGLIGILYTFKESVIVAGMVAAVRPVVAVLLGIMAYDFYIKTKKGLGKIFWSFSHLTFVFDYYSFSSTSGDYYYFIYNLWNLSY